MHKVSSRKIFTLDTIAKLSEVCALGNSSFIGGSPIDEGGHNPREPAYQGNIVISGTFMSGFEEISEELVACGGGVTVADREALYQKCLRFLEDADHHRYYGDAARAWVIAQQGVLTNMMN